MGCVGELLEVLVETFGCMTWCRLGGGLLAAVGTFVQRKLLLHFYTIID